MDPIAAYRKQQERLGQSEPTEEELRQRNPRWGIVFDAVDSNKDALISQDETYEAMRQLLGSTDIPHRKLMELFASNPRKSNEIDFNHFTKLVKGVTMYMAENPTWKAIEAASDKVEKEVARARSKERNEEDIFSLLGIKKTQEMKNAEASRKAAMNRAKQNNAGPKGCPQPPDEESNAGSECRPLTATEEMQLRWNRFEQIDTLGFHSASGKHVLTKADLSLQKELPQLLLEGPPSVACLTVRFSGDGSQLAAGYFDGGLRFFDAERAIMRHCLNLPFRKGGTEGKNEEKEQVDAYDSDVEFKPLEVVKANMEPAVTCVRWLPSETRINAVASVDTGGVVSLWSVPKSHERSANPTLAARVEGLGSLDAVCFSQDASRVFVGGSQRTITCLDLGAGLTAALGQTFGGKAAPPGKVTGHVLKIVSLCAHPSNPNVFFSGGVDRKVIVWDVRMSLPAAIVFGPDMIGDALDVSRDGKRLLVGNHRASQALEIYDLSMLNFAEPVCSCVAIERDQGSREAYDWEGDEPQHENPAICKTSCLIMSTCWDNWDNKTIVAAGEKNNMARVFETSQGGDPLKVVGTFYGKEKAFLSSAITFDGRNAAFGSADGGILLVDIRQRF